MKQNKIDFSKTCPDCNFEEKSEDFCKRCLANRIYWTRRFNNLPESWGGQNKKDADWLKMIETMEITVESLEKTSVDVPLSNCREITPEELKTRIELEKGIWKEKR